MTLQLSTTQEATLFSPDDSDSSITVSIESDGDVKVTLCPDGFESNKATAVFTKAQFSTLLLWVGRNIGTPLP